MMNEELIDEIKGEIARCELLMDKTKTAIAVANEQRERYAEMWDVLRHLLSVAEKSTDEQSRKGMIE